MKIPSNGWELGEGANEMARVIVESDVRESIAATSSFLFVKSSRRQEHWNRGRLIGVLTIEGVCDHLLDMLTQLTLMRCRVERRDGRSVVAWSDLEHLKEPSDLDGLDLISPRHVITMGGHKNDVSRYADVSLPVLAPRGNARRDRII